MAKINCPKDYNYWRILYNTGINPADKEKYQYDEQKEELTADIEQTLLDSALSNYDHQAWLKELEGINNPKSEIEILKTKLLEQEKTMEELMFNVIPDILGGGL